MARDRPNRSATTRSATHTSPAPRAGTKAFGSNPWRHVIATGVASAALFACDCRPVHAQVPITPPSPPECVAVSAGVITCTGDLSPGIDLSNAGGPYQVLNISNLVTDITPATGVTGVLFTSNGPVSVNINTAPFAIRTTDANGVFASSNGGTVTITSTADIFTTGGSATGLQGSVQNDLLTITSSGNISTSGNNAFGIAAGSLFGDIVVTSTGNISTTGTFAAGINVGSIGTPGTPQGAITINSSGDIITTGNSAIGINASSVNGPIDITSFGAIDVSGANSIGIDARTGGDIRITSSGSIVAGPGASVAISALSQLGNVTITATGDIATAGDFAVGIYATAGGTAMVLSSGSIVTTGDNAAAIAAAGQAGTAVISTSNIRTFGDDAPGITVMSDGDAAVASSGNIITTGDASDAINVVSNSGMVAILNSGDISASGMGSAGIYAAGFSGANVINFGAITGCPCGGVILDGFSGDNNLINFGSIISDLNGSAIEMTMMTGGNLVENFGTVSGNVLMAGTTTSVFENNAGALFNPGDTIIADVINAGTLAPGGTGTVETTTMTGSLTQNASGILAVDIVGTTADRINITATHTAQLAGNVAVDISSLPTVAAQSFIILRALGGVTNDGLGLLASPLLHATLTFPNATDVVLGVAVDFHVNGLNPNQRAIAGNLGQIFAAGGGAVSPVLLGLLNVDSLDEFKAALNELSPEIYSNAEIAALYSSLAFSNSLLSCKVNGADTASIVREGQCLWAGANARFLNTGTTSDQIGFDETAGLFTAGAQVALDNVWRLGVAGGFQSSTLRTATGAESDGQLGQGGIAIKYNPGPLLLAAAVTGGGGSFDTTRPMSFGGFTGIASGDQALGFFSGTLRAAYVLGDPHLYLKPVLDAALTRLELDGFTESGGNGAALTMQDSGQTVFSLAPTAEVGTEWWLSNGTLIRPLIRGGMIWYSNADLSLTAAFAGAPLGVSPFTINTNIDEVMGLVGAGVDVVNGEDSALRLSYDGQLGETTQIHSVGIKGSARF